MPHGAIAVGPLGSARWSRAGWAAGVLPAWIPAARVRAIASYADRIVIAGGSKAAVVLPHHDAADWSLDKHGIVIHGVHADAAGVVLVGERARRSGSVGVLVAGDWGRPPVVVEVAGSGPLRAVSRLGGSIFACGDRGSLATFTPSLAARCAQVCAARLHAVHALSSTTAVVVGVGSFAFSVDSSLVVSLEAVQTTKTLFSLARAPDGAMFCGGADGRVLQRDGSSWRRLRGAAEGSDLLAIDAGAARVRVFADDGAVLECRR